jgi:hypothetical protein
MITLKGQLAIKTIHGRNGPFSVGRLVTEIGEFVVKSPELEQYEEGKYDGEFFVVQIYTTSYTVGGRMVIEIRATLGGMTLSGVDDLNQDDASRIATADVDPIDEEKAQAPHADTAPAAPESPEATQNTRGAVDETQDAAQGTPSSGDDPDQALFGALWPLGEIVKLDPTVQRGQFRNQRKRLGELGYRFEPFTQDWHQQD